MHFAGLVTLEDLITFRFYLFVYLFIYLREREPECQMGVQRESQTDSLLSSELNSGLDLRTRRYYDLSWNQESDVQPTGPPRYAPSFSYFRKGAVSETSGPGLWIYD